MDLCLIGYFPKRVIPKPDWLEAAGVKEICSVSTCISEDPDGWIEHWLHNDLWVFPTIESARRVLPVDEAAAAFQIHAYRMFPTQFDHGVESPYPIPSLQVEPLPADFVRLGYDAVGRSSDTAFDCSPLSCNHGAEEFAVNRYCLVNDAEQALELARIFSMGNWEPGPYFVVEVLRSATPH
jgi:hypothetical protein